MSTTVKHFHSAMSGAPTLNGVAGSLIAILDACLVDGFGLKTADSVTVSGGVGTANFSTGHSFEPDVIALVTGATPAGLNGEKRVLSTSTNTITFDATDIADGTATGTITFKVAPLGWAKPFSGSNLAAYKPSDPMATGCLLRVDDSGTMDARVKGYESMTDINSGIALFPSTAQMNGGLYWPKSTSANTTARNWAIVGDGRTFYFWCVHGDSTAVTSQGRLYGFGDFVAQSSTDLFACFLAGAAVTANAALYSTNDLAYSCYGIAVESAQFVVPRPFTGIGSAQQLAIYADSRIYNGTQIISGAGSMQYPNGPDNGLLLNTMVITESGSVRGRLPGYYFLPQNIGFALASRDQLVGQNDVAGQRLLALRVGSTGGGQNSTTYGAQGCVLFNLTGPWR